MFLLIALFACSDAKSILALEGDPANGEAIFADNCAVCHGADALGGSGPDIAGITPSAEDVNIIQNGEDEMPGFADTLSDQDIADVLSWLEEQ